MKSLCLFLLLMSATFLLQAQKTPAKSSSDDLDAVISDLENNKSVKDRRINLRNIQFVTGKAVFTLQDRAYLDTLAIFMVKAPTLSMEISGYTDNVGREKLNNKLSQNRANAIKTYLIETKRINAKRLVASGYGPRNFIASNDTETGRAMNRRVELRILGLTNEVYYIVTKGGKRVPVNYVVTSKDNKTVSYRENEKAPLVRVPAASLDYIEYPDGTRRQVGAVAAMGQSGNSQESKRKLEHSGVDWMQGRSVNSSKVGDWFSGRFPKIGRWSVMANAGIMPLIVKAANINFAYVDESPSRDNLRNTIDLTEAQFAPGGQIGFEFSTDKFFMLRTQYHLAKSNQAGFSGFLVGIGKGFGKRGRFATNLDLTLGSAYLKLGQLVQNDVYIQVNSSTFYSKTVDIKFRNYFAALTPHISYDLGIGKGMNLRLAAGYSYSFNTKSRLIFKGKDANEKREKASEELSASNVNFRVGGVRQTEVNLFRFEGLYATVGFLYHLYAR